MMAARCRAALLLVVALGATAWAPSSNAGPCKDEYRYVLSVRPSDDSAFLSIESEGVLPIRHIGGEKTLVLSVERLDADRLLVEAMFATESNLATWRATITMDSQYPKAFGREFRPKADMPVFGIALIPLCKGT
jgi:hypothetical protein